jgi:hypothetical protein
VCVCVCVCVCVHTFEARLKSNNLATIVERVEIKILLYN